MSDSHNHANHNHAIDNASSSERALILTVGINIAIIAVQVAAGVAAHSVSLFADAGHNLSDVAAVVGSLVALRLAKRSPTPNRSFGFHRAPIIAAQANSASIIVVTVLVAIESIRRLMHPGVVNGKVVLFVALGAAIANAVAASALHKASKGVPDHVGAEQTEDAALRQQAHEHRDHSDGERRDLNMDSAFLHMAGDAVGSLGVAVCGAVMMWKRGWYWLDPVASLALGALIATQAVRLLRQTVDVLLEATPAQVAVADLVTVLASVEGVSEVHDVHVWTIGTDRLAMSAHLVVQGEPSLEAAQAVSFAAKAKASTEFRITHATFELESATCRDDGSWCAFHD